LAVSKKCPLFVQPSAVGGNSVNPVGDYYYKAEAGAPTTALLARGDLNFDLLSGASGSYWRYHPSQTYLYYAACAIIVNPFAL
ncbi:MAG: hypothetical protein RR900_09370, partial [Ruthenibacterium sp.]